MHQECQFSDMQNHDWIWIVRSRNNLDRWSNSTSKFREPWHREAKNIMQQECRFRDMRYRDSIPAIESRMNLDRWFNSLSEFRRSGLEGVENSHGQVAKSREDMGHRIWRKYEGPIVVRYGEAARQIWQSWSVGSRAHVEKERHVAD